MRSPTLLLIRMNAAETSASSAIADWTPLTVVSRSSTTAEIDTFISDVSTTSTNIAIASRIASRGAAGKLLGFHVGSVAQRGRARQGCAHAGRGPVRTGSPAEAVSSSSRASLCGLRIA